MKECELKRKLKSIYKIYKNKQKEVGNNEKGINVLDLQKQISMVILMYQYKKSVNAESK